MESMDCDVATVGGGITGLTLAWMLKRLGRKVLVFERASACGGVLQTDRVGECLLEIGPNTILAGAHFIQLASELGLSEQLLFSHPSAKKRYLLCRDKKSDAVRLAALPTGLGNLFGNPHLPLRFYREVLRESFVAPSQLEDESVRDFITRRLGKYTADYLVSPLLSGIWAADISRLSARSALAKLWSMEKEYGSITKAVLWGWKRGGAKKDHPGSPPNSPRKRAMVSFRNGLASLANALQATLGPDVLITNTRVVSFSSQEFAPAMSGVSLTVSIAGVERTVVAKQLVLAASATDCANLLQEHDSYLAQLVRTVPSAPVGVLHLSVKETEIEHPLDGFGFLCAPSYGKNVLGVIFSSSIFEGRAPKGQALLTCFSGGMHNPQFAEATNPDVQREVLKDVRELLGVRAVPTVLGSYYYPQAIPNYALGHHQVQEAVSCYEKKEPRVIISGNWLKGISVADRIDQAIDICDHVVSAQLERA